MKIQSLTLALLVLLMGAPAFAADGTWTNTAGNRLWSTAGNWLSGTIAQDASATASFTNTTGVTVTNDFSALTNCNFFVTNASYTIAGSNITLAGSSGTSTFNVATSRTLTVSAPLSGANLLYKIGDGTLTLSGATTYSGGTEIAKGILTISSAASLGGITNGTLTLSGGGRLTVSTLNVATTNQLVIGTGGGLMSVSGNNNFTTTGKLTGADTFTAVDPGGAGGKNFNFNATNNDLTGGITINGANGIALSVNSLPDSANNIVFTAVSVGNGTFNYGSGATTALDLTNRTFEINSAVALAGVIQNNNGTNRVSSSKNLIATGAGAKTFQLGAVAGPTNVFSGSISNGTDGGSIAVTKSGAGTWSLNGTNTYSGYTTISAGTLIITTTNSLPDTNYVWIATSAKLQLDQTGTQTVDRLYLNNFRQPPGTYGTNGVTYTNTTFFNGNGVLQVTDSTFGTYGTTNNATWTNNINGLWSDVDRWLNLLVPSNDVSTVVNFSGNATLTASNDIPPIFLNQMNMNSGTVTVTGNQLSFTNNGATDPSLNINNNNAQVFSTPLVLYTNLTLGGSGSGSTTLSGAISGSGGIIDLNSGSLTLTGSNSFSGNISINAGSIVLNAGSTAASLGASANTITFTGNSTFNVQAVNLTLSQAFVVNGGVTATLFGNAGRTTIITNSISGAGNIQVQGSGTTLIYDFKSTNNTLSGNIQVGGNGAGHELRMDSLADSVGSLIYLGNATRDGTFTYGTGAVVPLVLNNRQVSIIGTTGGGFLINNATNISNTVTVNKDLLIGGTGAKTFLLGGTNTGTNRFNGVITNGVGSVISFSKAGVGTWAIGATNTFTGTLDCQAGGGTLIICSTNAIAACTNIVMNQNSSSTSGLRILDDGVGLISHPASLTVLNQNSSSAITLSVGNNNTANGGSSSGTTSNSTIALARLYFDSGNTAAAAFSSITSSNNYSLQFNKVDFKATPNTANWSPSFGSGNCPIIIAGPVQQLTGCTTTGRNIIFQLTGTSTANAISGNIANASDFPANTNTVALAVVKSGTGTWTLSGTNTYTGTNTITAGILSLTHTQVLPTNTIINVTSNGTLNLNYSGTMFVNTFQIGGTNQNKGVWGSLASLAPNKTVRITGSGLLDSGSIQVQVGTIPAEVNTLFEANKLWQ